MAQRGLWKAMEEMLKKARCGFEDVVDSVRDYIAMSAEDLDASTFREELRNDTVKVRVKVRVECFEKSLEHP